MARKGMSDKFVSEPVRIGKHDWRVLVDYRGFTIYEFRCLTLGCAYNHSPGRWHDYRDWPRYDRDDGMYGGMPKTLVKLWDVNKAAISPLLNSRA